MLVDRGGFGDLKDDATWRAIWRKIRRVLNLPPRWPLKSLLPSVTATRSSFMSDAYFMDAMWERTLKNQLFTSRCASVAAPPPIHCGAPVITLDMLSFFLPDLLEDTSLNIPWTLEQRLRPFKAVPCPARMGRWGLETIGNIVRRLIRVYQVFEVRKQWQNDR